MPTPSQTALNAGAANDSAQDVLRKHLSAAFEGPNWDAFLAAVAKGDEASRTYAEGMFDQLFKSTASGIYLDRLLGDGGFPRPAQIGMSDDLYRKLGIALGSKKVVTQALWEILEVFYGTDAARAHTTSSAAEPFSISDGDTLSIKLDETLVVTTTFSSSDFQNASLAKAVEVAGAITRACRLAGSTAKAIPFKDPASANTYVRIYSGALGFRGGVRCLGGKAQNALLFPTQLAAGSANAQWNITFTAQTGVVRMTWTGTGTDPAIDPLVIGDYVNLYGAGLSSGNKGTFTVTKVFLDPTTSPRTMWFEFTNSTGTAQLFTQASSADVMFFRASKAALPKAYVAQGSPTQLDVVLPATTQAVNRGPGTAAYLHGQAALAISTLSRDATGLVTVTTSSAHGLSVGNRVFIDGAYPAAGSGADPDAWAVFGARMATARWKHTTTLLLDGRVLITGGLDTNAQVLSSAEFFDPATRSWSSAPSMSNPRYNHRATLMADGRVHISGGQGTGSTVYSDCEKYDPGANAWSAAGTMHAPRYSHVAVTLTTGKLLLAGGNDTEPWSDIYDPTTNSCTQLDNDDVSGNVANPLNPFKRPMGGGFGPDLFLLGYDLTATTLTDGRVIVVGGYAGGTSAQALLYRPSSNDWFATDFMVTSRELHSSVLLNSGKVVVIGGSSTGADELDSTEIWDPATGHWTAGAALNHARYGHKARVLPNGRVMVVGGVTATGVSASTEESIDAVITYWTEHGGLNVARTYFGALVIGSKLEVFGGGSPVTGTVEATPQEVTGGGLNGCFAVNTIVSPTVFTVLTPNFPFGTLVTSGTVTPARAPATDTTPGPYTFDPSSGLAVTGKSSTLTAPIFSGQTLASLPVADATQFPDAEGWLVIGFGTSKKQAPIHYLGRISNTSLLLAQDFKFTVDIPSGARVNWLFQKGPWLPDHPELAGSFYLTASPAGRVAASGTIDDTVAAGIEVTTTVVYPGDRGMGGEGRGVFSDKIRVWAGDDVDAEVAAARNE